MSLDYPKNKNINYKTVHLVQGLVAVVAWLLKYGNNSQ